MSVGLLTAAGLVATAAAPAAAAPHNESPPSVQLGYTDSATPTQAHDAGDETNQPLGTRVDDAGVAHTSRVYATFDLSRFEHRRVIGGKVFVRERNAADCTKRAVEIWRTKAVTATPTWRRAPAPLAKLAEVTAAGSCSADLAFDVSPGLLDAAAKKQRYVTFEIRVAAEHEADPSYGREVYWYGGVSMTVSYNSVPRINNDRLYNGGFACTALKPYPRLGHFANSLQVLGTDADDWDAVRTEAAVWPTGEPGARTVYVDERGRSGRANTVSLPDDALTDGVTYAWQARVGDGLDASPWSKKCYFTYDVSRPSAPTVTSSNYPPDGHGTPAPVGEPGRFTFSGGGDKDVAGFQYSWSFLPVSGCEHSGDVGQLVCADPFSSPGTVRANAPGGTATVSLSPPSAGPTRLLVRAIDLAGNTSQTVVYETMIPSSSPTVERLGGPPEWGQEVVLKVSPAAGVTGVYEYEYTLDSEDPQTVSAEEDGTAYIRFTATGEWCHQLRVRSRSANGFLSSSASWSCTFFPWPGVRSDVYPETGPSTGGVGVEGTFHFSPPPGVTDTVAYRYRFASGDPVTEVAADENGRATITWTPQRSGAVNLRVQAVRAGGAVHPQTHHYGFEVPDPAA
ncbi:MAG TPA: hypothetical protein VES42_02235 [Pilimelia sp.]|nr:hypothetical protein [Pilimelia sp.]